MVLELHQVHSWLRLDRQRRQRFRDEFTSHCHLVDLVGGLEFDHARPPFIIGIFIPSRRYQYRYLNTGYADRHGACTPERGAGESRATPRCADEDSPSRSRPRDDRAQRRHLTRDTAQDRGRKNAQPQLRHGHWTLQCARLAPAECRRCLAWDRRPTDGYLEPSVNANGHRRDCFNVYNVMIRTSCYVASVSNGVVAGFSFAFAGSGMLAASGAGELTGLSNLPVKIESSPSRRCLVS